MSADPLPRFAKEVVLRRLAPSDLPEFQAYRSDPVLARYQDWRVKSDADATVFLAKMSTAKLLQPGKWSQIAIADPDSLSLIGDIGLLLAGDGGHAEIGFTLRRESQGRGIGTAAVREAINLMFEQTDVDRVLGIADARNIASIRLMRRVGMHITGTREAVFHEEPCIEQVYVISRRHAGASGVQAMAEEK